MRTRTGRSVAAVSVALLLLAILILPDAARACGVLFDPAEVTVGADGKGSVMVRIEWEHRRCVLDEQDVNVAGEGGVTVTNEPYFEKVKRGVYEARIDFKLSSDKGRIRVWRDCSKKGISEGTITVTKK